MSRSPRPRIALSGTSFVERPLVVRDDDVLFIEYKDPLVRRSGSLGRFKQTGSSHDVLFDERDGQGSVIDIAGDAAGIYLLTDRGELWALSADGGEARRMPVPEARLDAKRADTRFVALSETDLFLEYATVTDPTGERATQRLSRISRATETETVLLDSPDGSLQFSTPVLYGDEISLAAASPEAELYTLDVTGGPQAATATGIDACAGFSLSNLDVFCPSATGLDRIDRMSGAVSRLIDLDKRAPKDWSEKRLSPSPLHDERLYAYGRVARMPLFRVDPSHPAALEQFACDRGRILALGFGASELYWIEEDYAEDRGELTSVQCLYTAAE